MLAVDGHTVLRFPACCIDKVPLPGTPVRQPLPCLRLSTPEQQVLKNRAAAHYSCEIKDLPAHAVLGAGATGGILYWLAIFPGGCGRGGCDTCRLQGRQGGRERLHQDSLDVCCALVRFWCPPHLPPVLPPNNCCCCSGCDQERDDDGQHRPRAAQVPIHPSGGAQAVGRG